MLGREERASTVNMEREKKFPSAESFGAKEACLVLAGPIADRKKMGRKGITGRGVNAGEVWGTKHLPKVSSWHIRRNPTD